jgi:hypothetical protein
MPRGPARGPAPCSCRRRERKRTAAGSVRSPRSTSAPASRPGSRPGGRSPWRLSWSVHPAPKRSASVRRPALRADRAPLRPSSAPSVGERREVAGARRKARSAWSAFGRSGRWPLPDHHAFISKQDPVHILRNLDHHVEGPRGTLLGQSQEHPDANRTGLAQRVDPVDRERAVHDKTGKPYAFSAGARLHIDRQPLYVASLQRRGRHGGAVRQRKEQRESCCAQAPTRTWTTRGMGSRPTIAREVHGRSIQPVATTPGAVLSMASALAGRLEPDVQIEPSAQRPRLGRGRRAA